MKIGPAFLAMAFLFFVSASAAQQEQGLIRLPKQATTPGLRFKPGPDGRPNVGVAQSGIERSLKGWLVLNGARFRNSEYPVLAKTLRENYAQTGYVSPDEEFTQLPVEQFATDQHGEVIKGFAVCPSPAVCGDFTGEIEPFNLDSTL